MNYPGDDLSSQGVAPQVSSALESLTSVFGMGTGGSSPLASPGPSSIGATRPNGASDRSTGSVVFVVRAGADAPAIPRDPAAC